MSEVIETTVAKKSTMAAPAAEAVTTSAKFEMPKFEMPKFEMPKFDMPNAEVPPAFREMAEKGIAQAEAGYAKLKVAAEQATDLIEDTYETARAGVLEYNVKALDSVKSNTETVFGFAKQLIGAKTLAEAIEMQTAFARKHFETMTAQFKDLQAIAQKVATETAAPVKAATEKAMKEVKAA